MAGSSRLPAFPVERHDRLAKAGLWRKFERLALQWAERNNRPGIKGAGWDDAWGEIVKELKAREVEMLAEGKADDEADISDAAAIRKLKGITANSIEDEIRWVANSLVGEPDLPSCPSLAAWRWREFVRTDPVHEAKMWELYAKIQGQSEGNQTFRDDGRERLDQTLKFYQEREAPSA